MLEKNLYCYNCRAIHIFRIASMVDLSRVSGREIHIQVLFVVFFSEKEMKISSSTAVDKQSFFIF